MTAYRPNGSAGSLTSPAFIIPAEAQALSWWWNNNQSASCDTDFILLDAQTGQNLTTLYANTCTGGTWKRFYADITAFAGRQVKLQIVNEDINERVYLDDVELTILVPGWIFSGNISGATTAQVAGGSYNGSNALYRPAGISGSLTSSAFEIPASAQTLSWWWSNNHQVNPDTDFYLLDAETGQVLVTMYTNLSTSGTWRHSYFNIAAYRGKIVQFRIVNEDGNEAFYLDDVQFNVQIPGWTLYGNTSASSSAQIKTGSYNGSKALFRPSGASGSMTSPVFVVPDEAQTLSWWWSNNHYVSPDTDFYLLDAETGQALATLYTNISTGGTWKQYFYNITPYRGKAVQFHVVNEDASEELYLDDLRLNVQIPGWEITGGVGGANVTQIASGSYDGSTALYRPAGAPASLTSPAFQIPPTAQTLNWWWNNNKSLMADTDFYLLDAQTGQTLATLASNVSTLGVWKQFSINISPYASRTVKLHVVNEDALEYLYLDNILITPYATQTYTISEINPIGYQSSTTDTIIQSFYGGQYFTVNFGDYTLDVAKSTLTVSPDSLTANGTETAQVVVSIKDALGNPMPGRDVRVESSGQNITIDQPELTTDAQGQVTATLHSTVAQTIEVKARDLAENILLPTVKQITFQPGPVDPQRSIFAVNPQAITANNGMTASVTITLRDAQGNPISGHQVAVQHEGVSITVEVSGGLTNAQGQTTALLRSSQAQTLSLRVLDQTAGVLLDGTQTLEIVSTDGNLSSIQVFPLTFPAGSNDGATITVTLRDINGNPVASVPVQLIISGEQNYLDGQETGILPVTIGTTDENGVVSAQLTSTRAEIKQIRALGQQISLASTGSVTVTSSTASGSASSVTLSTSEVVADGQKFSAVTVLVKDAYGNPVSGHKIQVNASGLEAQVSLPEPPLTDSQGRLTASVTSTQLGTALITVLDETAQLPIGDAMALTFIPGPADSAQSQVDVQSGSLVANGTSQAMITITLKDSAGHRLTGHEVQLTASGSGNIVRAPAPAQTDIHGVIVITVSSTRAGQKILTIVDRTSGVTLTQKPVLTFIAGPVSAQQSRIETDSPEAPADGQTPANIIVTVLDAQNNPIQGASVHLSAGGSAVVSQPVHLTDAAGKTTGQVRDARLEKVTISATVNGSALQKTVQVTFRGTDLAAELTGTTGAAPEGLVHSSLVVKNTGNLPASDVTVTVTLPDELELVDQTAATTPVQVGGQWVWELADIAAGKQIAFDFNARVATDAVIGSSLTAHVQVSSASSEADTSNNLASQTITVIPAFSFNAGVTPAQATLNLGGSAAYTLQVSNTGQKADSFHFSLNGLAADWVTLSTDTVSLTPGAAGNVVIQVATSTCFSETTLPFEVVVSSDQSLASQTVSATVLLSAAPQITVNAPAENSLSGSTSVLLSWRTQPETTGTVSFYPAGHPENTHTYTTENGLLHTVQVDDLLRNQSYEWSASAFSACGSSTIFRHFTVGNGIVFVKRTQSFNIQRDYDQQVKVSVRNDDAIPHTLVASVQSPSDDLIINFVGSGSQDQTITLAAGETRQITLAAHAQDAQAKNYQVTVHLVAEPESSTPISDSAVINLALPPDSEINYTVEEDVQAFDPLTLGRTYVITNHGSVITDLSLTALTPDGMPANMLVQPSLDHARLESGQSLRVVVYPVYEAADVEPAAAAQSSGLQLDEFSVQGDAPAGESGVAERPFNIIVSGSRKKIQVAGVTSCPSGKQVYPVKLANVTCSFNTKDWYCTNRPVVNTPIQIPAFLSLANLASASLGVVFTPHGGLLPHNGEVFINGSQIASFYNTIPSGQFTFPIAPSQLTSASAGMLTQNVQLNTQHQNKGHYASSSDYVLNLSVNQGTTYACAASADEARQAVMQTYSCSGTHAINPWTDVYNGSTLNWGEIKKLIKAVAAELATTYQISSISCTQGDCGDPINTRTGVFSFATPDISFPTSAGDLVFHRAYSSGSIDQYNDVLGYGWTHNHDARLLFPADPATITGQVVAGMEEMVIFKDTLGNQYLFGRQANGSFRPAAGVLASLTQTVTDTVSFTLTTPEQARFIFDEDGVLLTRTNPQGQSFTYIYNEQGKLIRISADHDTRYIDLGYDEQGRIVSVTDYTGRQVTYAYGAAGDLVSSTDLLGQTWRYTYDSAHRLTQLIDPAGKETVTTEYDMSGRAYRQFDGAGNLMVQIVYNPDGSTTVYDGLGNKKTHASNEHHLLTDQKDEVNRATHTTYDANFRPMVITNAGSQTLTMEWSADGKNLLAKVDPAGGRTEYTYNDRNNLTSVTDSRGNVTTYTYMVLDGSGASVLSSTTDPSGRNVTYTYTLEGYLASKTDSYGRITSYSYNAHGQLTSTTDWQEKTTIYSYDDLGRLVDTQDEQGRITHNEYNVAGQLLQRITNYDPDRPQNDANQYNIITSYGYDSHGNQIAVTDTLGQTIRYEYDAADRLIRTIDQAGNVSTNVYNEKGQLVSTIDPLGNTTQYLYDAAGRRLTTINAMGQSSGSTTFDIPANTSTAVDAMGHTAVYTYDSLNRVIKIVDPLGNYTTTSYDDSGNVASRTDALGRVSRYEYDPNGRLLRTIDPLGGITESVYDEAGNRVATIDPLGHRTEYTYDSYDRLVSTRDTLGNQTFSVYDENGYLVTATDTMGRTVHTEYDAWGRRAASVDADGQRTVYTYDALDRVVSTSGPFGTSTTVFDALGRVVETTDEQGRTSTTTYDVVGRVVMTVDGDGNAATQTYDAAGSLISVTDSRGRTTTYTYDALKRRIATTDSQGHTSRVVYDVLGNVTDEIAANGVVTHYVYDELNRRVAIIQNYRPVLLPNADTNVRTDFTYNAVGNRTQVKDANGNVTEFRYDALNRVTVKIDPLGNTWSFTYDLAGNLTARTDANGNITRFTYDAGGQLTMIDYPDPDADVTFTYNAAGQ
ncbi:MAG TPA: Ig-like domain-containing protein, partial [Anaerolineaceae bacterium]|nr:Ig-like domain-containing protein [Anaerolineaceae bacterium]